MVAHRHPKMIDERGRGFGTNWYPSKLKVPIDVLLCGLSAGENLELGNSI